MTSSVINPMNDVYDIIKKYINQPSIKNIKGKYKTIKKLSPSNYG